MTIIQKLEEMKISSQRKNMMIKKWKYCHNV